MSATLPHAVILLPQGTTLYYGTSAEHARQLRRDGFGDPATGQEQAPRLTQSLEVASHYASSHARPEIVAVDVGGMRATAVSGGRPNDYAEIQFRSRVRALASKSGAALLAHIGSPDRAAELLPGASIPGDRVAARSVPLSETPAQRLARQFAREDRVATLDAERAAARLGLRVKALVEREPGGWLILSVNADRKLTKKQSGDLERSIAALGWRGWGIGDSGMAFKPTTVDLATDDEEPLPRRGS